MTRSEALVTAATAAGSVLLGFAAHRFRVHDWLSQVRVHRGDIVLDCGANVDRVVLLVAGVPLAIKGSLS